MVIYGEYLFVENFITGLVIAYFTGKIAGEKEKLWRIVICGASCGAYSFMIFTDVGLLISLISKLAFVVVAVLIAFGFRSWKRVAMNAILFLMVTFFYGGITIALLISFGWEGVTAAEGLYMPTVTYLTVTAAATAAALLIWLSVSVIKEKRHEMRSSVEVLVGMGTNKWRLAGFIDTGNFLKDPITGKPVAVVPKTLMEKLLKECEERDKRYTVIPYNSVGVHKGIMDGYRVDYLKIPGKIIKNPILAVYDDDRKFMGNSRGQILLPREMLERGIYANFD